MTAVIRYALVITAVKRYILNDGSGNTLHFLMTAHRISMRSCSYPNPNSSGGCWYHRTHLMFTGTPAILNNDSGKTLHSNSGSSICCTFNDDIGNALHWTLTLTLTLALTLALTLTPFSMTAVIRYILMLTVEIHYTAVVRHYILMVTAVYAALSIMKAVIRYIGP